MQRQQTTSGAPTASAKCKPEARSGDGLCAPAADRRVFFLVVSSASRSSVCSAVDRSWLFKRTFTFTLALLKDNGQRLHSSAICTRPSDWSGARSDSLSLSLSSSSISDCLASKMQTRFKRQASAAKTNVMYASARIRPSALAQLQSLSLFLFQRTHTLALAANRITFATMQCSALLATTMPKERAARNAQFRSLAIIDAIRACAGLAQVSGAADTTRLSRPDVSACAPLPVAARSSTPLFDSFVCR